jgi:hypothetical protein
VALARGLANGTPRIIARTGAVAVARGLGIGNASIIAFGGAATVSGVKAFGEPMRVRWGQGAAEAEATAEGQPTSEFFELVSQPNSELIYAVELTLWAPADKARGAA